MPGGKTLRYDNIPVEDFLTALVRHQQDRRPGYLPPQETLKEVMFEGLKRFSKTSGGVPLRCYRLQETDAITGTVETFLIIHGEGSEDAFVKSTSLHFKAYLEKYGVDCLFRIDPRYGLLVGSASEPVDTEVKWNRPGAYATLYLTGDSGSPSLALMDYVALGRRERYKELFRRYNKVSPRQPGFLATTWKRFRGSERAAKGVSDGRSAYLDINIISDFLRREKFEAVTVSLIYQGVAPNAADRALIDANLATFLPRERGRFFASLGELA